MLLKKYVILGYHIKDRSFDTGKLFFKRYSQMITNNVLRKCAMCELWSRDRSLCPKFLMDSTRFIKNKLLPFIPVNAVTICTKYKFNSFCYIPAKDVIKKV